MKEKLITLGFKILCGVTAVGGTLLSGLALSLAKDGRWDSEKKVFTNVKKESK